MGLQNVWEVCKFSDEIVYGKLDVSKFAVELHSVLDGSADKTYTDAKLFLDKTFLTSNAKLILKDFYSYYVDKGMSSDPDTSAVLSKGGCI